MIFSLLLFCFLTKKASASFFHTSDNDPSSTVKNIFNFGAIFHEKEDAHLVAAVNYFLSWLNQSQQFGADTFRLTIKYVELSGDRYDVLHKACQLFDEAKVIALFGSSNHNINNQLRWLADMLSIPFFMVADDLTYQRFDEIRIDGVTHVDSIEPVAERPRFVSRPTIRHPSEITIYPQAYLVEAISDLICHWKWSRIVIVYVEIERIKRLIPFLENEVYNGIRFYFLRVENGDFLAATAKIKTLEDYTYAGQQEGVNYNRILIDMNPEDTYQFLLAALQMGFIDLRHWYLTTSMDLRYMDMQLFRHNHARFIAIDPIHRSFPAIASVAFNFSEFAADVQAQWKRMNGGNRNFLLSEAAFMFDALYLAAHSVHNFSRIYPITDSLNGATTRCGSSIHDHVPYRYGHKLIGHIKKTTLFGLTGDLSRVSFMARNFSFRINLLGYAGVIEDIGFWEPITDVNVNMSRDSQAQLQRNVKVSDELKPHFRVTTIMERPYVMLKRNHFGMDKNSQFEGFCIDLLEELANDLGFTYSIHIVKDSKYGSDPHNNGSWDGMIGEILKGEADMVVAPLTANFKRAEVVDFTKPFLSLGISILFKIPEDHQPDLFSFLNPLSLEIWFSILLSICALTIGMYIVAHLTPYEWNLNFSCCTAHQPHPAAQYATPAGSVCQLSNNYSFWNTLWYVMSTMLKGGCDFGPRAVSTRVLGGTWWMFTLVIVSAYTANLAAVLTVSRPHIPIRSLDDLANQSSISYGTIRDGSTMQFFQESKIDSHIRMWKHMKGRDVFVRSNREGVDKVIRENYAYLMESSSLEYEVQQNCNLTQIGGVLGSKGYGIALRKKSEWTDRISLQILLYQKRGIIEMKKTKWGASCHGKGSAVKQQRISLNLNNVSGLFVILSMGLLFSLIIVLVEFIVRKREETKHVKEKSNYIRGSIAIE